MTRIFAMRWRDEGIVRRFTKIHHPWTNGELERMNRTVKDAILKRFHYDSCDPLRRQLDEFVAA
jgi:transposase InsO family protein